MFVNRESELEVLENRHRSEAAELIVAYGRRRVGKTVLLQEFAGKRHHAYFLADLRPEPEQIRHFAARLSEALNDPLLASASFASWDPLLEVVARTAERRRFLLIIDEYPYLQSAGPAIGSILQRLWDERLRATKLFLILCGSQVSIMENEVLGRRSPLYGRRTGQLLVEPFTFSEARKMLGHRDARTQVETYAIAGGIPAYLEPLARERPLFDLVRDAILRKDGFLYNEVRFLLAEEMREPRNYFAILSAVAEGRRRLNEIVQRSGLSREMVTRYIDILRDLRVLRRDVPVTEPQPHKSRKGLYAIEDSFFRFWFRFVYPHADDLEREKADLVLERHVKPGFADFVAPAFEGVCREAVRRLSDLGALPFRCRRVGSWWDAANEIDIVGLGEDPDDLLVGECKWTARPVGTSVLDGLRGKAAHLSKSRPSRNLRFILFSRAGFTPALRALAAREGVLLRGLTET